MTPEFLQHDDNVRLFAELLSVADAHGLYNPVQTELFMLLIQYKRLVDGFVVCYDKVASGPAFADHDQRKAVAAHFRQTASNGEEITPRVAQFIEYLASMIEG